MKNKEHKIYKDSFFHNSIVTLVISIISFVIGIVLFILYNNKNFIINFVYRDIFILGFGLFFVLISFLILYVKYLKVLKRQFYIEKQNIHTIFKGAEETNIPFDEIGEIYRYRTLTKNSLIPVGIVDCLAYRKNEKDNWIQISSILKNKKNRSSHLIKEFIDNYIQTKCSNYLDKIRNGESMEFIYLSEINSIKKDNLDSAMFRLTNKSLDVSNAARKAMAFCDVPHFKIKLNSSGFVFNNTKIILEQGDRVITKKYNVNYTLEQIEDWEIGSELILLNKNDEVKHSLDVNSIINGDLFVAILKELVKIEQEIIVEEDI